MNESNPLNRPTLAEVIQAMEELRELVSGGGDDVGIYRASRAKNAIDVLSDFVYSFTVGVRP